MICPYCGTQQSDGAKFCNNCGANLPHQNAYQQPDWQRQAEQQRQQNWQNYQQQQQNYQQQQQNYQQNQYGQQYYRQPLNSQQNMPMKWFKFIIYVQLFLSMLFNLLAAIDAFTGLPYGDEKSIVYSLYPSLKTIDIIYGVLLILLVIVAFVARQKLAGFKKDGPNTYLIFLGANVLVSVLYFVLVKVCTGLSFGELNTRSVLPSLVISAALIAVNADYFRKRKHLFIN